MKTIKYPYTNFQKSNLQTKCKGCKKTCTPLYDHHHDLHFSYTCGKIIMQSSEFHIPYTTDPYYWEKEYTKRREIKQLKKIVTTLKELNKRKLTINIENRTITIHNKLNEDNTYIINRSLRDTDFELIQINDYHIIQKKTIKGAKKI